MNSNFFYTYRKLIKKIVGTSRGHSFQLLVDCLKLKNGTNIVELGCGNGWVISEIIKKSNKNNIMITGVDSSLKEINEANSNLNLKIQRNVKFFNYSASKLPFETEIFDLVFSMNSFHHFNSSQQVIQEAKRVLVSNGKLFIVDHCNDYITMKLLNIIHKLKESNHNKYFSTRELVLLLENNGFKNIQIKKSKPTWFWGLMCVQGEKDSS